MLPLWCDGPCSQQLCLPGASQHAWRVSLTRYSAALQSTSLGAPGRGLNSSESFKEALGAGTVSPKLVLRRQQFTGALK